MQGASERTTRHVSDQHRTRQQVGNDAQLQARSEQQYDSRQEAEDRCQNDDARRITARQRHDRRTGQQADGGIGGGDDMTRAGKQG
jgi:hypothetical protein